MGKIHPSQTWQGSWKPPQPIHANPCLVKGCSDEAELKQAMSKYGEVSSIFIPAGQGFAFVRFSDDHHANKAVKGLNGKEIGGNQVQVKDGKACDKDVLAWRDVVRGDKAGATSQEQ